MDGHTISTGAKPTGMGVPDLSTPTTFHDLATSGEATTTVASNVEAPSSRPLNLSRQRTPATSASSSTSATLDGRKMSDYQETKATRSGSSTGAEVYDQTEGEFAAIKSAPPRQTRPSLKARGSSFATEEDLFKALSQRRTRDEEPQHVHEVGDEVKRLMSRMFGTARQQHSEDEHTRHAGVVFRNLTVKGVGLGASLQPTVGDIFLGLPRLVQNLVTQGPKAAFARPPVRDLLHDLDGCVRPGEMLLVLGRPGSGCSTFLKTFCNQRAGYADVQGEVTYGGVDAKRMAKDFRGEVIYNPEDDLHYATLSVRRTLRFALQTRTPGKESRLEGESKQDYVQEFLRVATKLLWIEHTLGTKVGNEYVRGVSGGERKRVSIAEALVTRASVQGWDNSSRGLDAATAVEYVQALRALTNMAHVSTAVSLYQAGESLYQLVDKVLLIHEGQCLYYGLADHAKQYFLDLGFECPKRWTTADFLTSVTDPHARSVKKGYEDKIPRSAEDFAHIYRNSSTYQQNLEDMKDFEEEVNRRQSQTSANTGKKTSKKNYTIPFYEQVWACTQRQFFVMLGDKASLVGKWGGIVFQALIVGSTFFQLTDTTAGVFAKGGVLFLILLFNALLALAEQTAAFESKPILLKHKNFSFYRPSAYALAQTVVDIPLVLIQVLLFSIIIYWMAGLAPTASQFFISILTQWLVTMATYAFFRLIAAVSKTIDDATKVTGVGIQVLIVYTGYLISPDQMRPWFAWLRFLNWIQYGFEMLMSNEFYNANMECVPPSLVPQGPGARPPYQSCTLAGSTPGSTVVNGGAYIRAAFSYTRDHLWRNFGFLWLFFLFFLACTCLAMERMKPNAEGGAITTFKRGQIPKAVENNIQTGGRKGQDVEKLGELPEKGMSSDASHEDGNVMEKLAKNETVFTFQDINYTIPYEGGERKLLQHVSGFVRPGRLTALMGASGAGKTTLLNTLAQRINSGTVTGEFLVDGRPLPLSFQRATGFAEQMDIHESTSTVREALQFSALLRQSRDIPTEEKYAYCETIIDLLEMRDIAGATIGRIGEGLNQEQRKRLTIGVELASKPELLFFLDEPTSGLDSGAAFNIVRFLRKLADAGQAVLCTIHQPSAILFEQFDELLLLKSGGRVVYNGPLGKDSQDLRKYFAKNGTGSKCPPEANPAEWMLDVIGAGNPDYNGPDYGDVWLESENHKRQVEEIQSLIEKRRGLEQSASVHDDREYAMPLGVQIRAVVQRSYTSFWRNPNYFMGIFFLHILTGLFNCFTFYHIGYDTVSYQERLFTIFLTLTICPPLIQQLQPVFLQSRNIFQSRENNAKIYSWFAWTCGVVLVEVPYRLAAGAVYFCCWWWGTMGYRTSSFTSGFTLLLVLLFELYYTSFGQAIASFSPNELLASLLVPLFFLFIVAFCGVIVPPQQLPTFWRSWMYWLTPFHYLLEALLGVAIHQQPVRCNPSEFARFAAPPNESCQSYVGPYIARAGGYVQTSAIDGLCEFCQYTTGDEFGGTFSVYYANKWRDLGVFCAFILFNYLVIFGCTWLRFRAKNPLRGLKSKVELKVKELRSRKGKE